MDCTIDVENYGEGFIFIEDDYDNTIYKNYLRDGDLDDILIN